MYRMRCDSSREYDVHLAAEAFDSGPLLRTLIGDRRVLVVTVPAVDAGYGGRLRDYLGGSPAAVYVLELSERSKTMSAVLEICAAAQRYALGRRDLLVAFGGGVCCDVVSVAATLIRRGIPYLCLPTTLVAQVDAGVGLKGGVNFGGSKSYLGCFTPPSGVLVDPTLLPTLPGAELSAGLAEILKVGLVLDAELVDRLRSVGPELLRSGFAAPAEAGRDIIRTAITLMLDELAGNPFEDRGLERLVDFGHTFSGRLEELSDYRLRHGEAVAIDMALSSALAVELGLLSSENFDEVVGLLAALRLPVYSRLGTTEQLRDAMTATAAHRDGRLNLVVPTAIGSATFLRQPEDVPVARSTQRCCGCGMRPAGGAGRACRRDRHRPSATSTTTRRSGSSPVLSRPCRPPGRLTTTSPAATSTCCPSTAIVPLPEMIT